MTTLTNDQCRATEDINGFIRALAETGIIEIRNHEFLRRQFGLLRGGHIGADLSDTMLTLVDALRRCSAPAPALSIPARILAGRKTRAKRDASLFAECVASRLAAGEEWEFIVCLMGGGEHMVIKVSGDGEGYLDVSIGDSTEDCGWRASCYPSVWRNDTEGLAYWLEALDPHDGITWAQV